MAAALETSSDYLSDPQWMSFSLTHVEYPAGDIVGKMLAISSLFPLGILCGFMALILFRRDLHTISFLAGVVIDEGLNWVLKHCIGEARPMRRSVLYTEYGMPSAHSQFMWFFSTYICLFTFTRIHHVPSNGILVFLWKSLVTLACLSLATIVSLSRIYLQYHTVNQVLCGAILGALLAVAWFAFTQCVLTPLFPVIASWRISEFCLIRDTTLIPNILWFEYITIRQECRSRSRKLTSMKSQ